jgi:hypothetical protein
MLDRTEFRLTLLKPLLFVILLATLLAGLTMGVVFWRSTHGRPHWSENIGVWDTCANMVLIFAWIGCVQIRKVKAAKIEAK